MSTLVRRRWRNLVLTGIVCAALLTLYWIATASLRSTSFVSGWVLAGACVVLASYNLRKKLTFLPLGASAAWLQAHLYLGLSTVVLFAAHIGFTWPNGGFEILLFTLYVAVAATGVVGLILTRALPPRLTPRGENIVFERLPAGLRRLHVPKTYLAATQGSTPGGERPAVGAERHHGDHVVVNH